MSAMLFATCLLGSIAILWWGGWRVMAYGGLSRNIWAFSAAACASALLTVLGVFLLQQRL